MNLKNRVFSLFIFLFLYNCGLSQTGVPVNGVVDNYEGLTAFTNCTLVKDPQTKIINAVLIIQKGKVMAVGAELKIPVGAKIIDLKGKWIYPSFIDVWSHYGIQL